ncbi:YslB family protein [Lacticaseibacillus jixianensis]|uniref:YslB family protein n=1 Tax=Lacticaseibacillus jixianensis TaxID=2486012 RepID=A0ABW4BCH6_9LACO|nr:YslB family protein [Lacticaseibacillus jixianensis]
MANGTYKDLLTLPANGPLFGQLMLRDLLMPALLGSETSNISYWAGRDLARKLPVTEDDLTKLFEQVGFGTLTAVSAKKQERHYLLSGAVVETRIATFKEPDFRLEAGFLAQSLQQILGIVVEANPVVETRKQQVAITVALDPKAAQPVAPEPLHL